MGSIHPLTGKKVFSAGNNGHLLIIHMLPLEAKPGVVLFGIEFWTKIINWEYFVECGMISPEDLDLFITTDDPREGWDYMQKFLNGKIKPAIK